MLNSVSAGTLYGIAHPLQGPVDLQRVQAELVTQDFERVHTRSVTPVDELHNLQPIKIQLINSTDAAERGRILESLRYRLDRPLLERSAVLEVSSTQWRDAVRRVQDVLAAAHTTRDPSIPSINVFA